MTYAGNVQVGARKGIEECKHQFAWDRWNCPESALQLSTNSGARDGKFLWHSGEKVLITRGNRVHVTQYNTIYTIYNSNSLFFF